MKTPLTNNYRFRPYPNSDHRADNYKDLATEFPSSLYSTLEQHFPKDLLNVPRDVKFEFMRDVFGRYSTDAERTQELNHKKKRQRIASHYKPLYRELGTMNASQICVLSFINAVSPGNPNRGEQSTRAIMSNPGPGVVAFDMLKPRFCEMLLSEVENFQKWTNNKKLKMSPANTKNKDGVVLNDFGLEGTLNKLMMDFVRYISKVYFVRYISNHGFVVEYGVETDNDLDFHVDDSEVTLNVCLGKQFTGGDLFFRGVRCEKHMNGETYSDEIFYYSHSVGHAVMYHGRHRHGSRATTNGNRSNLLLWCRSSMFREVNKHRKGNFKYCRECKKEKHERLVRDMAARL